MLLSEGVQAQKIDFNNQANANNTSTGYTGWDPIQLTGTATSSMTINGVTVTIGHGAGTQATKVKSNWYANGVNKGLGIHRREQAGVRRHLWHDGR